MVNITCNGITFSEVKAIFFDKDGTLENSRQYLLQLTKERIKQISEITPNIANSLALALGIANNRLNPQGLMAVGSKHENEIGAAAYVASYGYGWQKAREIVRQAFIRAQAEIVPNKINSPIFPGARNVIQTLVEAKVPLGIISADSVMQIQDFVARENIENYFEILLGSDKYLSKPDPSLYLKACELLKVKPQNTLMVGDSVGDIVMAEQAEARATIGIDWHNSSASYLDRATVKISDLQEIKVIL